MRKVLGSALGGLSLLVAAGCSESAPSANSGATAGTAGTPVATAGSGGSTTAGSGGTMNSMGGSASGGSDAAGAGGMSGGSGGASGSGGAGGSGGAAGHVPVPSKGCGKANPPEGARMIQTGGKTGNFNVYLPDNYEASTPMPLGFGFHGNGNDECGPDSGECRGFKALPAVTVYMKSLAAGWEQSDILEANVTYWQDVLAMMKNEYCIDESRVFVAGVSSGGQFIEHLTCRFGDTLWQTTAVCASVVNAATQNCKGTPPILVIHGVTDMAGGYGLDVAKLFAERNGCSDMTPAAYEQARTDLLAAREAEVAEHICMDWDGCTLNPVRFCISSQITYSGLTHGWPMVGGQLIGEFQTTLK